MSDIERIKREKRRLDEKAYHRGLKDGVEGAIYGLLGIAAVVYFAIEWFI